MNKITFFSNGVSGGGAERVVCELCNYLVERKYDVDLVTVSDDESDYGLSDSINRICLLHKNERTNPLMRMARRVWRLLVYICRAKTDCYVVFLPHTTILLLLFAFLIRVPIIVAERSIPSKYPNNLQIPLKLLAPFANGFVFQNEIAKDWYGKRIEKKKRIIIPNAVSYSLKPENVSVNKNHEIIAVGRLVKSKNYGLLVDAFNDVKDEIPDYVVNIYGEGQEKRSIEDLIKKHGLEKRVFLCGYSHDIAGKLAGAELFVMCSDYEGMPNSLIEAMAMGLPCISTDFYGGAARELITDGENGIIVPVGDKKALCEAIVRLANSKKLQESLSENARKINKTHAPEVVYNKWENFICTMIDRRKENRCEQN